MAAVLVIVPFIVKFVLSMHEKSDKLATENRKLKRDAEILALSHRMDQIESNNIHRVEELSQTLADMNHRLELIYNKLFFGEHNDK